jgi:inner membrane protein
MAVAILPDLDVLAFSAGIPYGSEFGHRGFSHSLPFAAFLAMMGVVFHRKFGATALRTCVFLFVACASHGVLDAFTNGGSGIAFLWPFTAERFFAPVTPIEVSPIGLGRFLSARGATVFASELLWVWLPCLVAMLAMLGVRRVCGTSRATR